jgi:hypothetical protein
MPPIVEIPIERRASSCHRRSQQSPQGEPLVGSRSC